MCIVWGRLRVLLSRRALVQSGSVNEVNNKRNTSVSGWFSRWFGRRLRAGVHVVDQAKSGQVLLDGIEPFRIVNHLYGHEGLPIPDWRAIQSWIDSLSNQELQASARAQCLQQWLLHMRDSLGDGYTLLESQLACVLSPITPSDAQILLGYVERSLSRVLKTLPGVAKADPFWRPALIVFQDHDRYYDYVSHAYPEGGEYGFSGGMYLNSGVGHFVTVVESFDRMEPVIAHEMTHACLAHLPIPHWLNEGLAVNTEHRLAGPQPSLYGPQEMHARHVEFWDADTIQEFWSGAAFHRSDDGMMLAYDLAKTLVAAFAANWDAFVAFTNAAKREDAGDTAAKQYLGVDLGVSVAAMFEKEPAPEWTPRLERLADA